MGGSTQPLYRAFKTSEELDEEVIKTAELTAANYMLDHESDDRHFLSIGLGFLQFAQKEPELYRLLYLSGKNKYEFDYRIEPYSLIFEKMKKDASLRTFRKRH